VLATLSSTGGISTTPMNTCGESSWRTRRIVRPSAASSTSSTAELAAVRRALPAVPASARRAAALVWLRGQRQEATDEDAARLSPLAAAHINMLGRYTFTPPPGIGAAPLRDPAATGEEG
jgi:hypothetical protein